jgi:hypothetical protein
MKLLKLRSLSIILALIGLLAVFVPTVGYASTATCAVIGGGIQVDVYCFGGNVAYQVYSFEDGTYYGYGSFTGNCPC